MKRGQHPNSRRWAYNSPLAVHLLQKGKKTNEAKKKDEPKILKEIVPTRNKSQEPEH